MPAARRLKRALQPSILVCLREENTLHAASIQQEALYSPIGLTLKVETQRQIEQLENIVACAAKGVAGQQPFLDKRGASADFLNLERCAFDGEFVGDV